MRTQTEAEIAAAFSVAPERVPPLTQSYNIAPTQPVAAIVSTPGHPERRVKRLHWGLIPSWARDRAIARKLVNARAETLAEKPSFRRAFRQQRCWIVADGFYEWARAGAASQSDPTQKPGVKQPYLFYWPTNASANRTPDADRQAIAPETPPVPQRQPFVFAGLWERWQGPDGRAIASCAIVTVAANDLMRPIHSRMPAILPPETRDRWLDPAETDPSTLADLLQPLPGDRLAAYPVSPAVNRPSFDQPTCLVPA